MKTDELTRLEKKLGYQFVDRSRLDLALTHRSCGSRNNERLEFLGDSIVNFIIADALFEQFPSAREGQLSRLRARMVKGKTLAEIAREFEIGECLRLGSGELKSGGFRRESILADALEAIIGAIYLDVGIQVVRERILDWFTARLTGLSMEDQQNKDPKTRLQEFLQARQNPLPVYQVLSIKGDAHNQIFYVRCELVGMGMHTDGEGSSRRGAEQKAARVALEKLGVKTE